MYLIVLSLKQDIVQIATKVECTIETIYRLSYRDMSSALYEIDILGDDLSRIGYPILCDVMAGREMMSGDVKVSTSARDEAHDLAF
jgi:hypothetical protein